MTRSVGLMYAVSGLVTAASLLAITAATVGLGTARPDGVEARHGAPGSVATASATPTELPASGPPAASPGVVETVRSEDARITSSALQHGTLDRSPTATATTNAASRRATEDDEHDAREHQTREPERTSRSERETR